MAQSARPNRFAGRCRGCGVNVAAAAGFLGPRIDGRWTVECPKCNGADVPVATDADRPALALTEEQQHIVDLFGAGADLAVEAGAGTGKTTTLLAIAQSTTRTGSYVAFNRAIVNDAGAKFAAQAPNVACATIHSLAFRAVGRRFAHRLDGARMRSDEVARRLGIQPYYWTFGQQRKVLQPSTLAGHVMKAIATFCNSADLTPSAAAHLAYIEGVDLPTADGKRTYGHNDAIRRALEPAIAAAWADLTREDGQLRFTPDVYLKLWALSDEPRIPGEFILVDEAQDLSPVMTQILRKQRAQMVFVGDSQQAIYGWRGAVNALESVAAEQTAYLTHSFRFGPEIAGVANLVLGQIESAKLRLIGRGQAGTLGNHAAPNCILTRSNAGAIEAVLAAMEAGQSVHLVGGGKEIEAFCRAARDLKAGQGTSHPDLACFGTWGEVQEYVDLDPSGSDLKLMVRLIDNYGVDTVLSAVRNDTPEAAADVVVSTAHKAKGREWDVVRLAGDFSADRTEDEERRLVYVAVTRARRHLDYRMCEPVRQLVDPEDADDDGDPDADETVPAAPAPAPAADPAPSVPAADVRPYIGRCGPGCPHVFHVDGVLVMAGRRFSHMADADGNHIDLPRCPDHNRRPFMRELVVKEPKPGARCTSQCWNAHRAECACPCGGRNHGTGHAPADGPALEPEAAR